MFCGSGKPPIHKYLEEFVIEFNKLMNSGFHINLKCLPVFVQCFICDTPAKCFLKCVNAFNSREGCEKCIQTGQWAERMVFSDTNSPHSELMNHLGLRFNQITINMKLSHHLAISKLD